MSDSSSTIHPQTTRGVIRQLLGGYRRRRSLLPGLKPASVLISLFDHPRSARTHLWLMRRPEDGTTHAGQVALPGGKRNAEDSDVCATALREAREELGIVPESVEVLGVIDDYVTITGFKITPVVGWIPSGFVPQPNPAEVARAFHAPLASFLEPGIRTLVRWRSFVRPVQSYVIDGEVVWGATGTILRRFGRLLQASTRS